MPVKVVILGLSKLEVGSYTSVLQWVGVPAWCYANGHEHSFGISALRSRDPQKPRMDVFCTFETPAVSILYVYKIISKCLMTSVHGAFLATAVIFLISYFHCLCNGTANILPKVTQTQASQMKGLDFSK